MYEKHSELLGDFESLKLSGFYFSYLSNLENLDCKTQYSLSWFYFIFIFLIDIQLIYKVLVSGVQQSDSVIHIYVCVYIYVYTCVCIHTHTHTHIYIYTFQILFPHRVLNIEYSFLNYTASDSFQTRGLQPTRLLCRWDFPGKILEWVAISSSRDPLTWGIELGSPAWQEDSLPSEPPGKPILYNMLYILHISQCVSVNSKLLIYSCPCSPLVTISLFSMSVSLFLFYILVDLYHYLQSPHTSSIIFLFVWLAGFIFKSKTQFIL